MFHAVHHMTLAETVRVLIYDLVRAIFSSMALSFRRKQTTITHSTLLYLVTSNM